MLLEMDDLDCKTSRKVVPNLVFQRLQKYDHSRPYFISKQWKVTIHLHPTRKVVTIHLILCIRTGLILG